MWVYDPPACAGVASPHTTYSQTIEKEKNMTAKTATKSAEVNTQTVETYPMEVAKSATTTEVRAGLYSSLQTKRMSNTKCG